MPNLGECLRVEGHYSTKQKEKAIDTVSNIIGKEKLPFTIVEKMLLNTELSFRDEQIN